MKMQMSKLYQNGHIWLKMNDIKISMGVKNMSDLISK